MNAFSLFDYLRQQGEGNSTATPPFMPNMPAMPKLNKNVSGLLDFMTNSNTPPAAMARLPDQGDVLGGSPPVNKPGAIILEKKKEEEEDDGGGGLFGTLLSIGMKVAGF